jgi:hypothetical protein
VISTCRKCLAEAAFALLPYLLWCSSWIIILNLFLRQAVPVCLCAVVLLTCVLQVMLSQL